MMRNLFVFSIVVLMASAAAVAGEEFLSYGSDGYKHTSAGWPGAPIPPQLIDLNYDDSMMPSGSAAFGWGECGVMDYNTQGPLWVPTFLRKWVDLPAGATNIQITVAGPGVHVSGTPYDLGIRRLYVNGISVTEGTIGYEALGACDNILEYTINVPDNTINEGANLITIWIQPWNQPWRFDMRVEAEEGGEPTIEELTNTILELDLPEGIENSLTSKLDAALASTEEGKTNTAVNQLNAFKNQVEAQSGKKISPKDAEALLASADAIIEAIESGA